VADFGLVTKIGTAYPCKIPIGKNYGREAEKRLLRRGSSGRRLAAQV
jgi:hypothetical protein